MCLCVVIRFNNLFGLCKRWEIVFFDISGLCDYLEDIFYVMFWVVVYL